MRFLWVVNTIALIELVQNIAGIELFRQLTHILLTPDIAPLVIFTFQFVVFAIVVFEFILKLIHFEKTGAWGMLFW